MSEPIIKREDPLLFEVEDFLQNEGVFLNGNSGETAHMDSYMTVIDFVKLRSAVEKIKAELSEEEWAEVLDDWSDRQSPTTRAMSLFVGRQLKEG